MLEVLGLKKIMSQVFSEKGNVVPVTVIDMSELVLAGKSGDNYILGLGKKNKSTKAEQGKFKELGFVPKKVMEVTSEKLKDLSIGDKVTVSMFEGINKVHVTGVSKGKGFAGVVKRWGFHGGPKTHGQSDRNRAPGSIGAGSTPGRVFKGKKMGGRMGGEKVTVKNLNIVNVDQSNNLLLVKGAVPGSNNSIVIIKIPE